MPDYAVRLRAPSLELLKVCDAWALKCEKLVMYEHNERADNLHCHFLLTNVSVTTENLKQDYRKLGLVLSGPGQVSFKKTFKTSQGVVVDINVETWTRYITYMSKGVYHPAYNKGFDAPYLEQCRHQWQRHIVDSPDDKHLARYVDTLFEHIKTVNKMTIAQKVNSKIDPEIDYDIDSLPMHTLRKLAIDYSMDVFGGHINKQAKQLAVQLYQTYAYKQGKIESNEIILPGEQWKPPTRKPKV